MNKIILSFAALLISTGAFADDKGEASAKDKDCDNGSLTGPYTYEVSGVNLFPLPDVGLVTRSTHVVGQVFFDGKGRADFTGFGSTAGQVVDKIGTGDYKVNPDCTVTGTMNWEGPVAQTSTFNIMLDQIDNNPTTKKAYHGYVLAAAADVGSSASGSITRIERFPK
ncbi:hypothetical protein [Methylobacter svalbardensis]|uniref:hypothetical protein n=1 Tax=Methylobacter svalbardensis TaxID=3080016 RepID=UPI0030EEA470